MANEKPISLRRFGSAPILSKEDIDNILEQTGVQWPENLVRTKFDVIFNNIVKQTLVGQLADFPKEEDYLAARSAVLEFLNQARVMRSSRFPPPQLPRFWVQCLMFWVWDLDEAISDWSKPGAPTNSHTNRFYPKAIGLLHAAFGVVPDSSMSTAPSAKTGAAFRFIKATSKRVQEKMMKFGFDDDVPASARKGIGWTCPADGALGKRLKRALEVQGSLGIVTAEVLELMGSEWDPGRIPSETMPKWKIEAFELEMHLSTH